MCDHPSDKDFRSTKTNKPTYLTLLIFCLFYLFNSILEYEQNHFEKKGERLYLRIGNYVGKCALKLYLYRWSKLNSC